MVHRDGSEFRRHYGRDLQLKCCGCGWSLGPISLREFENTFDAKCFNCGIRQTLTVQVRRDDKEQRQENTGTRCAFTGRPNCSSSEHGEPPEVRMDTTADFEASTGTTNVSDGPLFGGPLAIYCCDECDDYAPDQYSGMDCDCFDGDD